MKLLPFAMCCIFLGFLFTGVGLVIEDRIIGFMGIVWFAVLLGMVSWFEISGLLEDRRKRQNLQSKRQSSTSGNHA